MKTGPSPDRPVSTTSPGSPDAGGSTTYPLGGSDARPAPTPGAPNAGAANPLPNTSPLPRNP
jgi:hypothetical protein